MANTLVGFFDDHDDAQSAVQDLVSAGIERDRISVVANDRSGNVRNEVVDPEGNLAAEGAAAGLSSGAVVGGIAGLLIGAGFTVLPIAGFLLAGPVAGLIAGAATGAATGGILGGLVGLGIPEEHAELYAEGVRRGGTLVTVDARVGDEGRVRDILSRDGAVDIEARGENWRADGFTGYDSSSQPYREAEIVAERNRYGTSINNDWNDVSTAPAPSAVGYDDSDYRTHFASNNPTGNYDEYSSAYSYGREIGGRTDYADDFDTNDSYRSEWESKNPGTWDKVKDAVRHAVDSVRGRSTSDNNRANLY